MRISPIRLIRSTGKTVNLVAPSPRLSALVALALIVAAGLLLASVGGCSVAAAPRDSETPAESPLDTQGPPDEGPIRVGVTADAGAVLEGQPATFTVTAAGAPGRAPVRVKYTVNELLTATISTNSQTSQPLSKVTIAALADLGYRVDYAQADSYSLPSTTHSLLRAQSAQDELLLGDHIRRGPVIVAEMRD